MGKLTKEDIQKQLLYACSRPGAKADEEFNSFSEEITRSLFTSQELLEIKADLNSQLGYDVFKKALDKWILNYQSDFARSYRFIFTFDLETTALDPRKAQITWLGWAFSVEKKHPDDFAQNKKQSSLKIEPYHISGAIPFHHRNPITYNIPIQALADDLKTIFGCPYITALTHNGPFDYQMLIENQLIDLKNIKCLLFDTYVAACLTNPVAPREFRDRPRSLKTLSKKLLGINQPSYQGLTKKDLFEDLKIDSALDYVINDVECTLKLHKVMRKRISQDRFTKNYFYNIEQPHMLNTIELSLSGLPFLNQDTLNEIIYPDRTYDPYHLNEAVSEEKLDEKIERLKHAMFKVCGRQFNFNSTDELSSVLFNSTLGISPHGINFKSKKNATDKVTLTQIFKKATSLRGKCFIALLLKAKQLVDAKKRLNDLQKGFNAKRSRTFTTFNSGTSSGRYSTSTPNFLGMSSSSGIKNNILAPQDRVFISSDYEQIDFRVIANESGSLISKQKRSLEEIEEEGAYGPMLKNVNSGFDLHLCTLEIFDEKARSLPLKKILKVGDIIPPNRIETKSDTIKKLIKDGHDVVVSGSVRAYIKKDSTDGKITVTDNIKDCQLLSYIEARRKYLSKPFNFGISYGLGVDGLQKNLNNPDDHLEVVVSDANIDELLGLVEHAPKDLLEVENQKMKEQLENVSTEITHEEIPLDQIKEYHAKFFTEYKGIHEFQELVDNTLKVNFGKTTTLFGRPVLAEFYHHLNKKVSSKNEFPVFDVLIKKQFYRLLVKVLSVDDKHFNCELIAAWNLRTVPSKTKLFEKPEDMAKKAIELIFCLSDEAALARPENLSFFRQKYQKDGNLKSKLMQFYDNNIGLRIEAIARTRSTLNYDLKKSQVQFRLKEIEQIVERANSDADEFFENVELLSLEEILKNYPLGVLKHNDLSEIPLILNTVRPFFKLRHDSVKKIYPSFFELYQGHDGNKYPGIDQLKRNVIATRVQATSMDFCKIAMTNFRKERDKLWAENEAYFKAKNLLPPKLINCVHDDIVIESPFETDSIDPIQDKVLKILESAMKSKGQKNCPYKRHVMRTKELLVHIDCAPKAAKRYSDL